MSYDIENVLRADLAPAAKWNGRAPYHFIGGNNDPDRTPIDQLSRAITDLLAKEGRTLATYHLDSGPQGYLPLRQFLCAQLANRAGIRITPDEILLTSGSGMALELVYDAILRPGDTVITEEASYASALSRLRAMGANLAGAELDEGGIRIDRLADLLDRLKREGRPAKLLYTIPTAQNPTGSVMSRERRLELLQVARQHDLTIFEDDCYADLIFEGERPPAIRALDEDHRVIFCGSFSKSIAPALRIGYVVADWPVISRLLTLKNDGGTGALDQMALAAWTAESFDGHVAELTAALKQKRDYMIEALAREFGAAAEIAPGKGGIFLWVTLPDAVDTSKLAEAALEQGVAINPGADWSADPATGRHKMRLCFAHPSHETIDTGIARLAEICHELTGIPARSGNVSR